MRGLIRKLILESIGDSEGEELFYGKSFVEKIKDNVFSEVLPYERNEDLHYERVKYIEETLGFKLIGRGHFRHVFETGIPGILLKVATDSATSTKQRSDGTLGKVTATDTNLQEVARFNRWPEFFPKSYAYDKKGVWLLVERVNVIETETEFVKEILKRFISTGNFDKNVLNAILAYSYQEYQNILQYASPEESAGFDFSRFANDIEHIIMKDVAGPGGGSSKAFSDLDKKDMLFEILKHGIEKGESYEDAVSKEVDHNVRWVFDEIKIHWIGKNLRRITENDIDYNYFKFANSIIDNQMLPLIQQHAKAEYYSDLYTRNFFIMTQREKISLWDIRQENTGIDENGQFKIIDATNFEEP
jgi:hypothetical protein